MMGLLPVVLYFGLCSISTHHIDTIHGRHFNGAGESAGVTNNVNGGLHSTTCPLCQQYRSPLELDHLE